MTCMTVFGLDEQLSYVVVEIVIISKLLRILSLFGIFHILLYTDLTQYFTQLFCNSIFDLSHIQFTWITKEERIVMQLKYCKIIHYKLWKVSQMISMSFGWTIISVCLVDSILSTNAMFWIFIMTESNVKWTVISKYFLLLHVIVNS